MHPRENRRQLCWTWRAGSRGPLEPEKGGKGPWLDFGAAAGSPASVPYVKWGWWPAPGSRALGEFSMSAAFLVVS